MHSGLTLKDSCPIQPPPFVTTHQPFAIHLLDITLTCFAKNMTSHGISEPIKPPSGSLDDGDHPHGPHSSKRVRFTESNDESPQADRGSMRYRLHDRLTRISKRPYLCNSIFLKSMGITFSPGSDNHTATAHEDATNGNGTRLPLWYLSYPGLRLDYMQTLMAQLGWTSDP